MTRLRIASAAIAAVVLAMGLTACSAPSSPSSATTPKSSTPTAEATPEPQETPTPQATAASPACDTIISEGTVKALSDAGWTHEAREFEIGDIVLTDGLLCLWADYSVVSDHGQLYGWAPVSAEDASAAQSWLRAQGWIRETAPEGVYFTEDPQFSLGTDEAGYGMTYLFGDGWVKLSDTKQGLILIEWTG